MKYMKFALLLPTVTAFQIFSLPEFIIRKLLPPTSEQLVVASDSPIPDIPESPRVAIVGAGAAGSSAAFWISKAKERLGLNIDIDVYERNDYIGGRM